MKKIITIFMLIFVFLITNHSYSVEAESGKIVYFYSPTCGECAQVKEFLEDPDNIEKYNIYFEMIEKKDISKTANINLMKDYGYTYDVPKKMQTVPIMFAGDQYFAGKDEIINAFENNLIQGKASDPLLEIEKAPKEITGFLGVAYMIFSGLLDGFNPCAMAMLLLFISLINFSKKESTLIIISSVYIFALFISYFALGTFLFKFLHSMNNYIGNLTFYINIIIIAICSILFIYNIYDYIVTRKQDYGKVKLQLPKYIQKFNKKFMKSFTKYFNEGRTGIIIAALLTFLIGVVISLTEFLCTGQIYLPVIISLIQSSESLNITAIIYLILYNLAFVTPLIALAIFAIKGKSIMAASNKIRENMHIVKLFNAILFLFIILLYIFKII